MPSEPQTSVCAPVPADSRRAFAPGRAVTTPGVSSQWLADLLTLTKARINGFVVGTALVGFALQSPVLPNWQRVIWMLLGTGLCAAAASVANQLYELEFDKNMVRTRNRPLPSGRMNRRPALVLAVLLLGTGAFCLGHFVNGLALALAALTFAVYAFAYTPLKRHSSVCIPVGAVSGALPLLIGWAASGAPFDSWTSVACAVLFLWQFPHVLAIAWRWRTDYARAGYHILPAGDASGRRIAAWCLPARAVTVLVSFIPLLLRPAGAGYWLSGLAVSALLLTAAIRFFIRRTETTARTLFVASLIYLPGIYLLMLLGRAQT